MNDLQEIYSELLNNPQFHSDFKKDPERALKSAGFELSLDDLAKIKAMVKIDKSGNEELDDRISK
jgi:hypothetical protein